MEKETLEFAKKFEEVRKKLKEKGLFDGSPEELFLEILETARRKIQYEELVKALADVFGEENLEELAKEIRNRNFLILKNGILDDFEKKNKQKILEFAKALNLSKGEATIALFNVLLQRAPKDLSLWDEFEILRKEKNLSPEDFFHNLIYEEKAKKEKNTELIPVSGKAWNELVKHYQMLPENQKEAVMEKLTRRINKAIESTTKEVKQILKKLEKKKAKK